MDRVRRNAMTWLSWALPSLLMAITLVWLYHSRQLSAPLSLAITLVMTINVLLALSLQRTRHQPAKPAEQTYRNTFDNAPIGILHLSHDGQIQLANQTAASMLGYANAEKLLQLPISHIVLAEDLPRVNVGMDALLTGSRNHFECDVRVHGKHRPTNWVQLVLACNRDDNHTAGSPGTTGGAFFLATLNNIQAIKHYEQLLSASERKFRTIAESLPAAVWMVAPDFNRLFFVNPAYEQIWGCSCESLYTDPHMLTDSVHAEDLPRVVNKLQNDGHWDIKYRIVRPDGEIRFIREKGALLYDDAGNPSYQISTAIDISLEISLQNRMRDVMNQLQTANEKLEQMVKIDALTQCYTRQVIIDEMEKELSRFKRYGTSSTLVFIDMNRFKDINDQYGHTVGDHALRNAAKMFRQQIRETDVLARYAGDEFVLLLKQTSFESARLVVDKLRATSIVVDTGVPSPVTVSASYGIATLNADIASITHWIDCADKAMYDQKSSPDHLDQ